MVGQVSDICADAGEAGGVGTVVESLGDPGGDAVHLWLSHAARGEGGRTDANAGGLEGWVRVVGNGVLIDGDAGLAEGVFGFRAKHAAGEDIDEDDMGVCASGDDAEAFLSEAPGQSFRVGHDLRGIDGEGGIESFAEGDGFGSNDMHKRAALLPGKDATIDAGGELLLAKNEAGTRSAQGFVCGGGDDVRVRNGRRMGVARDEAGEVRHVHKEVGTDFICDGAHAGKVKLTWVSASSADDEFGFDLDGLLFELIVVDDFGIATDLIGGDVVELAGKVELVAVGKVSAMGQVKPENGIAGGEQGHECGSVGLGPGVGLDVCVIGTEEEFGAVAGEILDDIGVLATAVVAFTGVAFCVLIGENGTDRFKNGATDEVFGRDHLEPFVLTQDFVRDLRSNFRIGVSERRVEINRHPSILCALAVRSEGF